MELAEVAAALQGHLLITLWTGWLTVVLHCWLGHLICKIVYDTDLQCVEWDVKLHGSYSYRTERPDFITL